MKNLMATKILVSQSLQKFVTKLPVTSGSDLIKFLVKKGFQTRKGKGSHVVVFGNSVRPFPVPLHSELDTGTLKGILAQAGIDKEEFMER